LRVGGGSVIEVEDVSSIRELATNSGFHSASHLLTQ
jgi:hypothetical protein